MLFSRLVIIKIWSLTFLRLAWQSTFICRCLLLIWTFYNLALAFILLLIYIRWLKVSSSLVGHENLGTLRIGQFKLTRCVIWLRNLFDACNSIICFEWVKVNSHTAKEVNVLLLILVYVYLLGIFVSDALKWLINNFGILWICIGMFNICLSFW